MKILPLVALAAGLLLPPEAHAQRPVIEKVDPPNWWAGHSVNPVRLLIRGRNLAGATFECARVGCSNVRVNDAGTYAFVDVAIPAGTAPGRYPLALRTGRGPVRPPTRKR